MARVNPISDRSFRCLHPGAIELRSEIVELLKRAKQEQVELRRGMNRRISPEVAQIESVSATDLVLRTRDFEANASSDQIFLNFVLDDQPYFFAATTTEASEGQRLRVQFPTLIHRSERRDRVRQETPGDQMRRVEIQPTDGRPIEGEIADFSSTGMGVLVPAPAAPQTGARVEIRLLGGNGNGSPLFGQIRNQRLLDTRAGWKRLGINVSAYPAADALPTETRDEIFPLSRVARVAQTLRLAQAGIRVASGRVIEKFGLLSRSTAELPINVVDLRNQDGRRIRAIIDSWGDTRGAPAVVIPPAWGRTKETTLPLASCLVASFRRAKQPIVVVRFDGIGKRGESFREPDCAQRGKEYHRFTFSQGARDISAVLDYLEQNDQYRPARTALVSFSSASVESRRAVSNDKRISGWVAVVGAPDLQSMMRVISGGVDYALGLERGVQFGIQEVLGVEVDMDLAGLDAARHRLTYLEDARRDMTQIDVPITWIHGRYDAWMDRERVRDALSRGNTAQRKLIDVPTGHMLSTSREALEAFQLVTSEISEMVLGRRIKPEVPDLQDLDRQNRAERGRLPKGVADLRGFWRDYLLGAEDAVSFELMTSITPYEDLMTTQVEALRIQKGDVIADLGAGVGAFPLHLGRSDVVEPRQILGIDYVREGLVRARARVVSQGSSIPVAFVEGDLEAAATPGLPLRDVSVDGVLASLLLSYMRDPLALLREARRVLKPGGRLVVSSLRRDADMSKLYREGLAELRAGRARELLPSVSESVIENSARDYLNQAAKLLDFEEAGVFRFMDLDELTNLVVEAGFEVVSTTRSLGSPSQAVVVWAKRPKL